jgi:uncharacterized protein
MLAKEMTFDGALIGMIHLPALPGAPRYGGSMAAVVERALRDAEALSSAGVDAIMVENFGDVPFPRGAAAPETVAALAVAAEKVRGAVDLPLGVNVLRNDARSALGVAVAVGASFLRVNVLAWARLTDQGVIEGDAAALQRARAALDARHVAILADVAVKHSAPLAPVSLVDEAHDVEQRALADAIVVTGVSTSAAVDASELKLLSAAVSIPLIAGSGVTAATARAIREHAQAAIVGSAMMETGRPGRPIDLARAKALVAAWREAG